MVEQLSGLSIALLIIGGLVAHLLLMLSARWLNPVVTLMGAFFLLAPVSAMRIPGTEVFKYLRLYVNVLAILLAIIVLRRNRVSGVGLAFFGFILFYMLAGLWSEHPLMAVTFKGLLLPVVVAGVLAAATVRSTDDLRATMRVLLMVSVIFAIPVFANLLTDPMALAEGGRFSFAGLNPNRLGHEAASMLIVCSVVALYDPGKTWKILAYATGTMLAAAVLASGSRAAAGEAAIAVVILGLPLFKRPMLPLTLGAISALILWVLLPVGAGELYDRYAEINLENRADVWEYAIRQFRESPIIGQGWVLDDSLRLEGATANLHSMYLQVLAETGLVGMFLLLCLFGYVAISSARLVFETRSAGADQRWVFCALAFFIGPLAHGIAESSSIQGSSINVIMMSFGLGLFAPLATMARAKRQAGPTSRTRPVHEEYGPREGPAKEAGLN